MDHKAWLWKKRSSEKTILAANNFAIPLARIEEEVQTYPAEKGNEPEKSGKNLNEKLASVLLDCHVKEDPVTEHPKPAEEAIAALAGNEKAGEAVLMQGHDEALSQGISANERSTHPDDALNECMQQLHFLREEQEQRVQDAILMTAREYEKAQARLEDKLRDRNQQLTNLAVENDNLNRALQAKVKLIEDLNRHKSQADAEFGALMARLDSTEKENAFLRYEFHMLEKELAIRGEEMEYNCRSAEEMRRQNLESVRKITNLEQECQRLHLLMQKRLPGPTALVNMKSEVQPRRKLNPNRDMIVRDARNGNSSEIPNKKMSFMMEQLRHLEEENKRLKDIITRKNSEVISSRTVHSRTNSRLSQAEKSMELVACPIPNDMTRSSRFDIGSDDGISSNESWASALISELEHFRIERLKSPQKWREVEVSDISLMDDFVEMEKLAIVSAGTPPSKGHHRFSTGRELVPVEVDSSFSDRRKFGYSKDGTPENSFDWLQVVLKAMLEQKNVSKRSLDELFEDIKIALGYINQPNNNGARGLAVAGRTAESDPIDSFTGALSVGTSVEDSGSWQVQSSSNLSKSLLKLIKLFEGLNLKHRTSDKDNAAESADYLIRVFKWKHSELNAVLEKFVHACHNMLSEKANFESFVQELTATLDCVFNNHVAAQDGSSMRNKIKKHFGWQEAQGDTGVDSAMGEPVIERTTEEQSLVVSSNNQDVSGKLQEENRRLKDEMKDMESAKKDMEARLQSATEKIETLMVQLEESQKRVGSLQSELESLKQSEGMMEDQIENQKSINEDLDTQLTVTKSKLNAVFQKFSSLEVELEDKHNFCEDLEATCLELQLQLQSAEKNETPNYGENQEEKQSESGWEMTTASVKLAECQETILNLGKQLKALAAPREAQLFDKVFSATSAAAKVTDNNLNSHSSLRDRMLAEDNPKSAKDVEPPRNVDADAEKPSLLHTDSNNAMSTPLALVQMREGHLGSRRKSGSSAVGSLAIVPSKKQGGFGFLKRLLLRKKKGSSKKPQSFAKA